MKSSDTLLFSVHCTSSVGTFLAVLCQINVIHEEVEILLVTSCYGNRDKLWRDGPLGLNADLNLIFKYTCRNNISSCGVAIILLVTPTGSQERRIPMETRRVRLVKMVLELIFDNVL